MVSVGSKQESGPSKKQSHKCATYCQATGCLSPVATGSLMQKRRRAGSSNGRKGTHAARDRVCRLIESSRHASGRGPSIIHGDGEYPVAGLVPQ